MTWKYLRLSIGFSSRRHQQLDDWLAAMTPFYARKGIHLLAVPDPAGRSTYVWRSLIDKDFTAKTCYGYGRSGSAGQENRMTVVEYHETCEANCLWDGEGTPPPDGHSTGALKRVPKTPRQARAGE